MTEIGLIWKNLTPNDQWYSRTEGKFRAERSIFTYNINQSPMIGKFQYGGMGIITTDDITHQCTGTGKDKMGLGRWA